MANVKNLKKNLASLKPEQAQEIKDAYYKAAEGLRSLFEALELADLDCVDGPESALLDEHFIALEAYDAFKKSELGKVL